MPRPTRKPAFDSARDVQADNPSAPQPSAGPTLPKVGDDDLPPLPAAGGAAPATKSRPESPPTGADNDHEAQPTSTTKTAGRPRGTGGRPSGTNQPAAFTKVPARVPGELYARAEPLVKGVGKPSWGQLVAWTCQDHQDDVVAKAIELATPTGRRRPRGQNQTGTASLQVTARMDAIEAEAFATVHRRAEDGAKTTVKATNIIIAALMVATDQPAA